MSTPGGYSPREIVSELDRYIVGQGKAKRAVAVALRNRFRRQAVMPPLRDEIMPKNIIMVGPTGVGKTEIARRLAKLAQAPFVKVEASKFTEVGYVGRDVESIIRDLAEVAIGMVRDEQRARVETRARDAAEERLLALLMQAEAAQLSSTSATRGPFVVSSHGAVQRPLDHAAGHAAGHAELRAHLRAGDLDDQTVELDLADTTSPLVSIFGGAHGMDEMESQLKDMLGQLPGVRGKTRRRKLKVKDARKLLEEEEAHKLIDMDAVKREAVERAEQSGIVFLDEVDKIAGSRAGHGGGPDVSREGVQRDLLPIVEGSTVNTKHGAIKTDHILFIAAGAFHVASVSDLIPELQGRFPIRVELDPLEKNDFARILREPKNALTHQYTALLGAEGIELSFTDSAIEAIAEYAASANKRSENIGARRLHTVMEALLEELSFSASERTEKRVVIDAADVHERLRPILADEDLAKFIL